MKRSIKKAIAFIVALALFISVFSVPSTPASAATSKFEADSWNVINYTGKAKTVTLPILSEEINSVYLSMYGKNCTIENLTIAEGYQDISLFSLDSLKTIKFPSTATDIYVADNNELTEITVPAGCRRVSASNCPKLSKITFEKSENDSTDSGNLYIENCNLQSLNVPSGFGNISISNCAKLKKVTLAEGVGTLYLDGLPALASINIPESVYYFRPYMVPLDGIASSSKIKVEKGCIYDGDTLIAIDPTKEVINVKEGTRNIDYLSLSDTFATTTINLPDSVEYIEASAFSGGTTLKNVNIPKNIVTIGEYAFAGTAIEKLVIPASVGYIYDSAFAYYNGTLSVEQGSSFYKMFESGLYYINDWYEDTEVKLLFYPSSRKTIRFKPGTNSIGSYAFINTSIKNLVIPEGVTYLDTYLYDSAVESLSIPSTVWWIDTLVLSAPNLTTFTVSPENEYYSSYDNCLYDKGMITFRAAPSGLNDVKVYNGCLSASSYAFSLMTSYEDYYDSPSKKTLTIPKSVLTMGSINCDKVYVYADSAAAETVYDQNEYEKYLAAEWGSDPSYYLTDVEFLDTNKTLLSKIWVTDEVSLKKGKKATISYSLPHNMYVVKSLKAKKNTEVTVKFTSSNKKIATVNAATGKITGVKKGTCTVTATFTISNGKKKNTKKFKIAVKVK